MKKAARRRIMTAKEKKEADWIWINQIRKVQKDGSHRTWQVYRDRKTGGRKYLTTSKTGRAVTRYSRP